MALDTSIFAQYLKPVKSIADYDAEYQTGQRNALLLDQARTAQASAAQKMQMDRDAAMRAEQGRNALMSGLKTADLNSDAGRAAFVQQTGQYGADFLKDYSVSAENFGKADKAKADAMKERGAALDQALARNRNLLNYVQTPQQAAQWAQSAYQDPDLAPIMQRIAPDAQTFAQTIPQDPQGFGNWRVSAVSGADKLREILAREMEGAQKTANDTMIPDGKGGFMVNKPLVDAKKTVASAGKTTVSVNTAPKAFWTDFGKANVEVLMKEREGATAASGVLQSVVEIRKAAEGGAYQGAGAELKLGAAKALGALGMPYDQQTVANSEVFDAQTKQFVLNSIKQLGANPSNTDREFIEKTVPGLRTDPAALPRLLTFLEGKARSQIRTFNEKAKRVQADPAAAQMPFQIEVPEPDASGGWGIKRTN